jgi:hypothetical protein
MSEMEVIRLQTGCKGEARRFGVRRLVFGERGGSRGALPRLRGRCGRQPTVYPEGMR